MHPQILDIWRTAWEHGLADATSEVDFVEKLAVLEEVWNECEEQFSSPPQFLSSLKYTRLLFSRSQ